MTCRTVISLITPPAGPVPLAAAKCSSRKCFYVISVMRLDLTGHKSEPVRSFVFAFVGICTEVKSQAPSYSLHAVEPLPPLWLYFIMAEYSCQSYRTILQYVCLDAARRVLRSVRNAYRPYFAFGSRPPCASIGRFCVRSRLSLFLCQEKRDGLREVAFLFRVGRDRH